MKRPSWRKLLPSNLAIQLYRAQLESGAGEQGARMTAMDNATRNAGEAINKLTLNYNRTRQANITRELIEIISGRGGALRPGLRPWTPQGDSRPLDPFTGFQGTIVPLAGPGQRPGLTRR